MSSLGLISVLNISSNTCRQLLLPSITVGLSNADAVRCASKKTGGSTRNQKGHGRPKHRGVRVQDGHYVQSGTILATQLRLRFHAGLNVGMGRNGTLFAMEPGQVLITCEKIDPNWDHTWIMKNYEGRESQTIYKKFFNVLHKPQEVFQRLFIELLKEGKREKNLPK